MQTISDVCGWGPTQDRWGPQPGATKSTYKTFACWTHDAAPSSSILSPWAAIPAQVTAVPRGLCS